MHHFKILITIVTTAFILSIVNLVLLLSADATAPSVDNDSTEVIVDADTDNDDGDTPVFKNDMGVITRTFDAGNVHFSYPLGWHMNGGFEIGVGSANLSPDPLVYFAPGDVGLYTPITFTANGKTPIIIDYSSEDFVNFEKSSVQINDITVNNVSVDNISENTLGGPWSHTTASFQDNDGNNYKLEYQRGVGNSDLDDEWDLILNSITLE